MNVGVFVIIRIILRILRISMHVTLNFMNIYIEKFSINGSDHVAMTIICHNNNKYIIITIKVFKFKYEFETQKKGM